MNCKVALLAIFLFSLGLTLGCGGGEENATPKNLEVVHFTRLQGLPNENITCMASFAGQVWAGSQKGLLTFDGANWKHHVSKNTNVLGSDIIEDLKVCDNALWIGTDNGAARYDGNNWSSVYTGGRARSVCGTGNKMAVATAHGVEYSSGNAFAPMGKKSAGLVYDEVNQVLFDSQGQLWVGTRAGMARMSSGIFQNYTGPAKSVMGSSLIDIPASPANCRLVGNNVKILMEFGDQIAVGTTSGLTLTDFSNSYVSYFSTHKDWAQRGGKIVEETITGNSPLPGNVINALATTPDAELLFVGTGNGLAILKGNNWLDTTDIIKDLPPISITGLAYVAPDLWVGTQNGIYRVKNIETLITPENKS
ncbi:MAG: ligand-binding sensor domain-containing protein [Candidatus Rifleibacteriota bacterium]